MKDLNFIENQEDINKKVELKEEDRAELIEILRKDSELLRKFELIDYSVFMLDIDLEKKFNAKRDQGIQSLVYNAVKKEYTVN